MHCLALDGDVKKFQGADFYVACAAKGTGTSPEVCAVGTHTAKDRPRVTLQGAVFLVRVKPSSAATKPKVLAGVSLLEADLPLTLVECGLSEMLLDFEAPPAIWKFILEHYPGRMTMETFIECEDDPSSGESKQGEVGRGLAKAPPESLLAIETGRKLGVEPPSVSAVETPPDPQLGGGDAGSQLDDDILNAFGMRRVRHGPGAGTGIAWGAGSTTGDEAPAAEGTDTGVGDPERWKRDRDANPYASWQSQFSDDASSSQGRSVHTYPPDDTIRQTTLRWRKELDKVATQVKDLSRDTSNKLGKRDEALVDVFAQIHSYVDSAVGGVDSKVEQVESLFKEQQLVLGQLREQIAEQRRASARGASSTFVTPTVPQTYPGQASPPPFK